MGSGKKGNQLDVGLAEKIENILRTGLISNSQGPFLKKTETGISKLHGIRNLRRGYLSLAHAGTQSYIS